MSIILKSYNYKLLDFFINTISKNKKFPKLKTFNLPKKRKKLVVLKSPHVNSKSKEHFEIVVYRRLISLKSFKKSDLVFFENFIKNNLIAGISVKINYFS